MTAAPVVSVGGLSGLIERLDKGCIWTRDSNTNCVVDADKTDALIGDALKVLRILATHQAATPDGSQALVAALDKAVVFNAYNAADPLAIRLEFETEQDRLDAANAIDAALPAAPEGGLGSFSQEAKIPTEKTDRAVLVPRDQLETLRRSLQLANLLPGEGETLIDCWIMASEAELEA